MCVCVCVCLSVCVGFRHVWPSCQECEHTPSQTVHLLVVSGRYATRSVCVWGGGGGGTIDSSGFVVVVVVVVVVCLFRVFFGSGFGFWGLRCFPARSLRGGSLSVAVGVSLGRCGLLCGSSLLFDDSFGSYVLPLASGLLKCLEQGHSCKLHQLFPHCRRDVSCVSICKPLPLNKQSLGFLLSLSLSLSPPLALTLSKPTSCPAPPPSLSLLFFPARLRQYMNCYNVASPYDTH